MTGFGHLLKNECIKIFKKTGLRVLIIIIAALMVLTPLFNYMTRSFIGNSMNSYYDHVNYNNVNEAADPITEAYNRIDKCVYDLFTENNFDKDSWVFKNYSDEMKEYLTGFTYFSLIVDNGYSFDQVNNVFPMYKTTDNKIDINYCTEQLNNYRNSFNALKDKISTGETKKILEYKLYNLLIEIANSEKKIDEQKKLLENNSNNDQALYEKRKIEAKLLSLNASHELYEFILNNKIPDNEWSLFTADLLCQYSERADTYAIMPESIFASSDNTFEFQYDNYLLTAQKNYKEYENRISILQYSIKNNIPLSDATNNYSSKDLWQTSLVSTISGIISIFLIVVGAQSVSSELSTGTARMLLIRPRKRWKILLSKYLAICVYGFLLAIITYIIQFIISIIVLGPNELFISDLYIGNSGNVYEVNSIISTLSMLFKALFEGIFAASIAFMMSVLTGKTVLGIITPYLLSLLAAIVYAIQSLFWQNNRIIEYTFIPYMKFSNYCTTANNVINNNSYTGIPLTSEMPSSLIFALIVMLSWLAVFLFFSFFGFNKRQIKS